MTANVVQRSQQLLAAGRTGEALQALEAERQRDTSPAIFGMLGYAYLQDNRISEATRVLEAGLTQHPFHPGLHETFARMRWLSGESEHFVDAFLAAVAARPSDLTLRLKCADLLRIADQPDMAERLLREGMAQSPDEQSIQIWLGVLLDEVERFDEAIAMYRNAIRLWPNEPQLRLNLAHALMRSGRADEAIREIAPVRKANPALQLALIYETDALRQLGDARANWICNYERDVQIFDIEPPKGFSNIAAFNTAFANRLRKLHGSTAHPLDQSLRGGTQTTQNLIYVDDPLIRVYFEALRSSIEAYIATMPDDSVHPLYSRRADSFQLHGCWSVLLKPNGFHVNHTHPAGWISSSYYVSVPPSVNESSQEGWIKFGEPRWAIPGCGIERTVQPKEGRLVLFPSHMWHGTIPFSSGERLTAPFDVIPAGAA